MGRVPTGCLLLPLAEVGLARGRDFGQLPMCLHPLVDLLVKLLVEGTVCILGLYYIGYLKGERFIGSEEKPEHYLGLLKNVLI